MKLRIRAFALFLALCLLLSAVPTVQAEADGFEYGPALASPLSEAEKLELLASLYEADIVSTREAVMAGLISCQELTAYYLQRIDAYAAPYHCFITICDNAMEVAKARDAALVAGTAEGDLYGIPIVVKDNIDYAGYATTNGYPYNRNKIASSSATVVARLVDEGAVILGKSNMAYGAHSASNSTSAAGGETKNAYSLNLAPGGSSGGSAVAVSLNFAMAGLGTDTGSSLRMPAALNGCYSMRTTRGLLEREGVLITSQSKDVVGSINRSAEDLALVLDTMSSDTRFYENLDADALKGAKFAIIKDMSGPNSGYAVRTVEAVDDEVEAAFHNAVEELRRCGAEVIELRFPGVFFGLISDRASTFQSLFRRYDLDGMIFPTYLHTPQKIGVDAAGKNWSAVTQPFLNNCAFLSPFLGVPEITIPIGNHSNGAGIGMEIIAPAGRDQQLLNFAYSYSLRYDHRVLPKGAPNDYAAHKTEDLKSLVEKYREVADPTWEYTQTGGTLHITACHDAESTVIRIPNEIDGKTVTQIDENALSACQKAELIFIPETVTNIHKSAFSALPALKQIGFGGNRTTWDAMALDVTAEVICDYRVTGDFTGDFAVEKADAVYLLRSHLFEETFPREDLADFDGDLAVTGADILRLYWHSLNPEQIRLMETVPQQ